MNNPRRGGGPTKGTGRSAAREGRSDSQDSGRDGRTSGGRSGYSSARPSNGGASKGFSKDRFVRGAAGEGGSDRPERGNDRPAFNRDRPNTGGDRPFRSNDRPDRGSSDRPPFNRDRNDRGGNDRPPFNRDSNRGDRNDRPAFRSNDRNERGSDRPNREGGFGGERKPFNRDDRGGSDRPSFNRDRNERGGNDRPPFNRDRPSGDRPPFNRDRPSGDRPAFNRDRPSGDRPAFNRDRPERSGARPTFNRADRPERGFQSGSEQRGDRPAFNRDRNDRSGSDRAPFNRDRNDRGGNDRPPFNRDTNRGDRNDRPGSDRPRNDEFDRPSFKRTRGRGGSDNQRPTERPNYNSNDSYGEQKRKFQGGSDRPLRRDDDRSPRGAGGYASRPAGPAAGGSGKPKSFTENAQRREMERTRRMAEDAEQAREPLEETDGKIRLNKFIAAAGICSRREADKYIEDGRIAVNGKTITELGFKVNADDEVRLGGRVLRPEKHVYILMNKPKNYITSLDDEGGRQTVMDLIGDTVRERLYPVGRLDRNTTGLLLLTNDGDLAERLMHPSFEIRKVYQVELDRPLTDSEIDRIRKGVMLEDGPANIDDMAVLTPDRKSIGLEIHIGRNRIVRRIFESLGHTVVKLDRVMYGGLTKKDLPRGNFRQLTAQEIINIKHLGITPRKRS